MAKAKNIPKARYFPEILKLKPAKIFKKKLPSSL
jgi:hypothetical protein